jgi:hypothetical protein
VDADQGRSRSFEVATDKGYVLVVIHVAGVGDHPEIAETCG